MTRTWKSILWVVVILLGLPPLGLAQKTTHKKDSEKNENKDTFTATPIDSGFGPLDTTPPATPPAQIIQQFAAKESLFRRALDNYTFRRSVKVQTLEDNKVDGEYQEVDDVSFDPTGGRRIEKAVYAPESTLERISMSPADFADIQQRLPFVLTTEDIAQYIVTYKGRQKVDELDTYVFDVGPKEIVKNHRYFLGRIWVDQQDLQIVLTSGKNVPDDTRKGHEDLSPPFTTYREQIDGKYWFPVYTKGEGELHFKSGNGYLSNDVHIREILKYTDYKQFRSTIRLIYEGQDITNNGQNANPNAGQNGSPGGKDTTAQPAQPQPDPPATGAPPK